LVKFPLLKNKKKLNVLVIGFGSIGKKHCKILKKFTNNINVFTSQNIKNFNKISSLKEIKELDPDYFIIASKTNTHFSFIRFIEKNFKNKKVLIEKPIMEKYRALKLKKNKFFVGYNLRFHPVIIFLKKFSKNKKINFININSSSFLPKWRRDIDYRKSNSASKNYGGALLELSHELDYASWIFGKFRHIYSFNKKISNLEILADDILLFVGKNLENSIINISINFFSRINKREIIIEGDNFTCKGDILLNEVSVFSKNKNKIYKFSKFNMRETYLKQHMALLKNENNFLCSVNNALATMKTIKKIKSFN